MSIVDTVRDWSATAARNAAELVTATGDWFRNLPTVPGPLSILKASSMAIDTGIAMGQGTPAAVAVAQSGAAFFGGGSLADSIRGTIDEAPAGWLDGLKSPQVQAAQANALPLWVKLTIAGAVVIGTAVLLQSLMNGGARAA